MYDFHTNVFARPDGPQAIRPITLRGCHLEQLTDEAGHPLRFTALLQDTWDGMAACLEGLPRMIFEPDGSWVWAGRDSGGRRWQVDGHLFELQSRLHRVELHGSTPHLEGLLDCFETPLSQLLFELVMEGVTLDADNFLRWAASEPA